MKIDTTRNEVNRALAAENMCSHLQRKLFSQDGEYRAIREQIETDPTLTAVVRSRQLHIYRDGKKILILAGKSTPKIIRDDQLEQELTGALEVLSGERGSAASLLALLPAEFTTADLIKLRARKGQSVKGSAISMVLNRWRANFVQCS